MRRLAEGVATGFRAARSSLDYHYSRRSHILMGTSDGRAAFAMFGGFRGRHRFGALFLPPLERWRTRLVVHHAATADYCRGLVERYGLVVFCGDSAPPELVVDLLSVPLSVDMEMPTPSVFQGPGAPWSRSAKANIARVKRGQFVFDVVDGGEWIQEFHRRMFRPSMRCRHGARAYMDSQRALARYAQAQGGELLRVFRNGQWVAASLNQSTSDGYRLIKLGWLDGDEGLLRSGIVSALYWFNFRRAAGLGHQRVLLGGVAPFLEDGVFLHKSHWGAGLCPDSRYFGEFRLLLEPSHPTCRRFLQTHSMVTKGTDQSFIVFSGRRPDTVDISPTVLRGIKRWYTWRDPPAAAAATSEEVPRSLRPWVTLV